LTTTLGPDAAARLFGSGERFVQPALRALPPAAIRRVFEGLGVGTVEEPHLEKVFPASQRAIDVRDALVRRATGADIRYRARVSAIERFGEGWAVQVDGAVVTARRVVLCPGGLSYAATGTTGDGYPWLKELDLEVTPTVPALVPLTSEAAWVKELTGISVQEVEARLLDPQDRVVQRRARPIVFTHHGISGPGAMDLSAHVALAARKGRAEGWHVALDLAPRVSQEVLRSTLEEAARAPGSPRWTKKVAELALPSRLQAAVAAQAGLAEPGPPLSQVDRKTRNKLVDALKGLRVPVHGTLGWDKAEVTAGGLALSEVERTTMQIKRHPGLYAIGEILDLQGPIGGLNFTAAFATGELAARAP
jgi:hypothetical protein